MGKEVKNVLQAKGKDVSTWEVKVNDQSREGSTWEVKVNDQSREGSKDGEGGLKRGCNVLEETSN